MAWPASNLSTGIYPELQWQFLVQCQNRFGAEWIGEYPSTPGLGAISSSPATGMIVIYGLLMTVPMRILPPTIVANSNDISGLRF